MLRVLGWLHLAMVGVIVGGWLLMLLAAATDDGLAPQTLGYIFGGFIFLIAPLLVPSLVGGMGLVFGQGWARVVIAIASVVVLIGFPIGTALGVFGFWALWKTRGEPVAKAAPTAVRPTEAAPVQASRGRAGVLLAAAFVALLFIVGLGAGFRISGDPAPAVLSVLFWPGVLGLAAIVVVVLRRARAARDAQFPPPSQFPRPE